MVEYKCLRCGYSNNNKSVFKRHVTRKFTCKPKIEDISIKDIYNIYFKIDKNNDNILCKQASANVSQNVSQCQSKRQPATASVSQQMPKIFIWHLLIL